MKLTDRKLKKLLRENPIQVNPAEKEKFLKQIQRETGGLIMKKRNLRPILAAVIALIGVTMLVSAGAIAYYYRTPGGNLVDESGNITETLTEADSMVNDRTISNGEVTIASVTWAQAENHTTLAVWLPADEPELVNPTAIVNGKEYPLTKKTFNLTGGMIGYTAVDVPKPETLKLRCDSPAFEETVNFQPDNIMSECTIGGITLFGSASGNTVYLGVNDENYLTSELFRNAELVDVNADFASVIDNTGAECSATTGGTNRGDTLISLERYEIPEGNTIVSLKAEQIKIIYSYFIAAIEGKAPSVKVPLPADGETVKGNWKLIDDNGISYIINSISRTGNDLTLTSDNGLRIGSERIPGTYCYVGIQSFGMQSGGGSNEKWTMKTDNVEQFADENGDIELCITELRLGYPGDWHLNFAE